MKKFVKMSLAAAVAVAGLSTTASAQPLEEAIQGVDFSGYLRYRYDETKHDLASANNSDDGTHGYKIYALTKSKINDTLTANVGVLVNGSTTNASGDANVAVTVNEVNFTFTGIENTTVIAGKQKIATPFTDAGDQRGTGVVAQVKAGAATLVAAYFMNNSINDEGDDQVDIEDQDIATIGIMGAAGPVNLAAWYADVAGATPSDLNSDAEAGLDAWTISADANIEGVKVGVRHTELEVDGTNTDNSLTKITISGKAGPVALNAGYAETDKQGGLVAFDRDSATGFSSWKIVANNKADVEAYTVGAGVEVMPKLTVRLDYTDAEWAGQNEATDTMVSATYAMSSNFTAHVRLSNLETETAGTKTADDNVGRLELLYKF